MKDEIEVKFLDIDIEDVRDRLTKAGARIDKPMRLMKRVVFDYPDQHLLREQDSWVRVRDEGDVVKLTFKKVIEKEFGGATEIEVEVSSYDDTIAIFKNIGMFAFSDQENYRESWLLGDVEIVIDEWPWLNPYIEVEGPSKEAVQEVAGRLGFDWDTAVFGSISRAYRHQYPDITAQENISSIREIKFSADPPDWFDKTKRQK